MKKLLLNILLYLSLIAISYESCLAQSFDSLLQKAANQYLDGCLYVQSNKQSYHAGETIYLKAYLKAGATRVGSNIKFELINASGDIVKEFLSPNLSFTALGSLKIPDNIKDGRYFIFSYTDAASKFRARNLSYTQAITITSNDHINSKISVNKQHRKSYTSWKLENEKLFKGIENSIYYLSRDQFGYPKSSSAYILNAANDTLCTGTSDNTGSGKLIFMPEIGQKYRIGFNNYEDTTLFEINNELEEGIKLSAYLQDSAYIIEINSTPENNIQPDYIIGMNGMNKIFQYKLAGMQNNRKLKLPLNELPNGIITLAILNAYQDVLAEKNIFVYNDNNRLLNKSLSSIFDKNTDSITISNTLDNYEIEDASISIIAEQSDDNFKFPIKSITESFLLLNYIAEPLILPKDYFAYISSTSIHQINSILSSVSLIIPKTKDILNIKHLPEIHTEISEYLNIYVNSKKTKSSTKVSRINSIFVDNKNEKSFRTFDKRTESQFVLPGIVFFDTTRVYFLNEKGETEESNSTFEYLLDSITGVTFSHDKLWIPSDSIKYETPIITSEIHTNKTATINVTPQQPYLSGTLKDVTVSSTISLRQKTKLLDKKYTKGLFSGQADKSIDLINEPYGDFSLPIWNYIMMVHGNTIGRSPNWNYYLNEGISTREELMNVYVKDVALVKLFRHGMGGVPSIAVYLKRYDDLQQSNFKYSNKSFLLIAGYPTVEPFVEEISEIPTVYNNQLTIKWLPVFERNDFLHQLNFFLKERYNNQRKYSVQIQGILLNGNTFYYRN